MATSTIEETNNNGLDPKLFRDALGHFASGVAIVTAKGENEELAGMTISSFNSVSLDPPLVLFSIDRKAYSLPIYEQADGYAINILEHDEQDLCMRFAKALGDKWTGLDYTIGYGGAPLLSGSIVSFECKPYQQYEGGDHIIFLAEVVQFQVNKGYPLVFYKGRFQKLTDGNKVVEEETWPLSIHY